MRISSGTLCAKVEELYQRYDRPILVGQVSIATGLSLKDAENRLEELVVDGVLRRATTAECREFDLRQGFVPLKK